MSNSIEKKQQDLISFLKWTRISQHLSQAIVAKEIAVSIIDNRQLHSEFN
ncbi:hypothetical protein LZQ00_04540 [Sphingobacterium sp. SRCM116780]|nr:hypothetical protein [Sphingobacterium sp. SRCM116780]UIR57085.1 hypothetical protein LZQ00_04540 [Sphingobacterium sp. SRCM116780]